MHTEWKTETTPVPYEEAVRSMENHIAAMRNNAAPEKVWLLEHPPLYTAGTSAKEADLLTHALPVFKTGRGGEYTYHGPGQRVAYVMVDLKRRGACDVTRYVHLLEEWVIRALAPLGIQGERREGRIGVWVVNPDGTEDKIAAIGVRLRKWVTYHGVAINVFPDLSHYQGIVPCGIRSHGVTSLEKLGVRITLTEFDTLLQQAWQDVFA